MLKSPSAEKQDVGRRAGVEIADERMAVGHRRLAVEPSKRTGRNVPPDDVKERCKL